MSGYFANLVARSSGTAEVIAPRVTSLFEPVRPNWAAPAWEASREGEERDEGPSEHEFEIFQDAPSEAAIERSARRPRIPAPRHPAESVRVELEPAASSVNERPRNKRADKGEPEAEEPATARQARQVHPLIRPAAASTPPKPHIGPLAPSVALAESDGAASHREAMAPLPEMDRAAVASTLTSAPFGPGLTPRSRFDPLPVGQAQNGIEPAVHVTIGRIEVRAIPEQAPRRRERPASPVMGLEEYLTRRRPGGSR
jgi:hypothetical protein